MIKFTIRKLPHTYLLVATTLVFSDLLILSSSALLQSFLATESNSVPERFLLIFECKVCLFAAILRSFPTSKAFQETFNDL